MRIKDLVNDIDNTYINGSDQFKRFNSKNIEVNSIHYKPLPENIINYKGTQFQLPAEIVESKSKSKIDSISNSKGNSFFLNLLDNQLFQIDNEIEVVNNLEQNKIYQVIFDYQVLNGDANDINLVIIEYHDNKGYKVRRYESNDMVIFKPLKKTTSIKIFVEPKKEVVLYEVSLSITLENRKIIEKHQVDLVNNELYVPDNDIKINYDDGVKVIIPELEKDYVYISHRILNNSFNEVPIESFFDFKKDETYHIKSEFVNDDTLEVTPVIVEYNDYMKTNLIKLYKENNYIKFQDDTKFIRLSYKFVGMGNCILNNLVIEQLEFETKFEELKWNTPHDMNKNLSLITDVKDLRICVIMDDFTYFSYAPEANLTRLTFHNWKNEIRATSPHFIFIESAWHGNHGEWTKCIAYVTEEKHKPIRELIKFAQLLGIKVVFWNKEDPVHFDHFIHTAKLCDFVFTTDQDRVEDYKSICNHENVDVLQFAAQPVNHNPIKIQKERVDGISFAGSYYGLREERSNDMNRLFKASIPHNLYIYDRNYEFTKNGERLNFLFPEEFRKYILGTLPFYEIEKAYKGYRYMININTVKTSPTMYARRVYEGLASGTPIISNYSLGMEKQFGDIIEYSENTDELNDYLAKLNNDPGEYNKVKQLGVRRVLSEHTYEQRLLQIAASLGYEFPLEEQTVAFIAFLENKGEIQTIIEKFEGIIYSNKQLIIWVTDDIEDYSILNKNISIMNAERLIENFETLSKLVNTDYISLLSQNDYYAPNYLKDLMLAEQYTDAAVIGKSNYFVYKNNKLDEINENSEHEYTERINISASIIRSSHFSNFNLIDTFNYLKENKDISELSYLGFKMYSNDKMNYIKDGNEVSDNQKYNVIV